VRQADGSYKVDAGYTINLYKAWNFDKGKSVMGNSLDEFSGMPARGLGREFDLVGEYSEIYSYVR
jgi:hypothetical protein